MNATPVTHAELLAEIDRSLDSIQRLNRAHPRAERIAQMAEGINPLQLTDDCRRAAATIRYHRTRIDRLQLQIDHIDHKATAVAHRAACLKEIA